MILILPLVVYVDDAGLIGGPDKEAEVDAEMNRFHDWSEEVPGIYFKRLKDRLAAGHQLYIGLWWNSASLVLSLEERKLLHYMDVIAECAGARTLDLKTRQSVAGKIQRAILTLPPGAACLLANGLRFGMGVADFRERGCGCGARGVCTSFKTGPMRCVRGRCPR